MQNNIKELAKLLRYYSLISTTEAGSGHPSSCLSAADLMAVLMFGGFFKTDLDNPENPNNDRLIFSKGHAAPLFYAIYAVAGQQPSSAKASVGESANQLSELKHPFDPQELMTLRKFGSRFEGHPTSAFPYTEVPTGSLGQGLSVGAGMALNAKLDKLTYRTFVLLGDSEMAEGSVWEAMAAAAYYKLDNLVGIIDVNRLGQRGETMLGHNMETYQKRAESFGWEVMVIDGHNLNEIQSAFAKATADNVFKPIMIIARTLKGKGVSILEDKEGKHGVALKKEELEVALKELGEVNKNIVGIIEKPEIHTALSRLNRDTPPILGGEGLASPPSIGGVPREAGEGGIKFTNYKPGEKIATRKAYGNALANLVEVNPNVVVLDAEISNSTYADSVKKNHSEKFVECFIAEQNMVGMALGFSRRGKIPFVSTFAAFLTRAYDQIRMSALAQSNIKFIGSHAGVSIGEDGSSQMGLEEIAMFRALPETVVLYPSDAVSTEALVYLAARHQGNVYIQTTRKETKIIYRLSKNDKIDQDLIFHEFRIGGSCTLKSSNKDVATVIGAGVTLHEALAAYEDLKKEGINIRVIDLYSIKPIDIETIKKVAVETKNIITVEDNHVEGGIGEAVAGVISEFGMQNPVHKLAVKKIPHSGKPDELLAFMEINKDAIIKTVKEISKI